VSNFQSKKKIGWSFVLENKIICINNITKEVIKFLYKLDDIIRLYS